MSVKTDFMAASGLYQMAQRVHVAHKTRHEALRKYRVKRSRIFPRVVPFQKSPPHVKQPLSPNLMAILQTRARIKRDSSGIVAEQKGRCKIRRWKI